MKITDNIFSQLIIIVTLYCLLRFINSYKKHMYKEVIIDKITYKYSLDDFIKYLDKYYIKSKWVTFEVQNQNPWEQVAINENNPIVSHEVFHAILGVSSFKGTIKHNSLEEKMVIQRAEENGIIDYAASGKHGDNGSFRLTRYGHDLNRRIVQLQQNPISSAQPVGNLDILSVEIDQRKNPKYAAVNLHINDSLLILTPPQTHVVVVKGDTDSHDNVTAFAYLTSNSGTKIGLNGVADLKNSQLSETQLMSKKEIPQFIAPIIPPIELKQDDYTIIEEASEYVQQPQITKQLDQKSEMIIVNLNNAEHMKLLSSLKSMIQVINQQPNIDSLNQIILNVGQKIIYPINVKIMGYPENNLRVLNSYHSLSPKLDYLKYMDRIKGQFKNQIDKLSENLPAKSFFKGYYKELDIIYKLLRKESNPANQQRFYSWLKYFHNDQIQKQMYIVDNMSFLPSIISNSFNIDVNHNHFYNLQKNDPNLVKLMIQEATKTNYLNHFPELKDYRTYDIYKTQLEIMIFLKKYNMIENYYKVRELLSIEDVHYI